MGGFGSGRPRGGGRATVEMCRSIDVNRLRRDGALVPGWSGTITWTRNGEQVAAIGVRGERDKIVLVYSWSQHRGEAQNVLAPIPILWRPCRFGGQQPFFVCPGVVDGIACNRLSAKLYGASRYFLCRCCYRLTYGSRSEDACERALRRANKIRMRLGGDAGCLGANPSRPKGMWRKTYDRLVGTIVDNESRAEERLARMAARLLKLKHRNNGRQRGTQRGYWR